MDTIIYIVGPTASGKTKLATTIAHALNGVLISADSIQVYKDLDIVSGKDLDKGSKFQKTKQIGELSLGTHLINNTSIYGLDIVNSTYSFHVSDYYSYVLEAIELIKEEKKISVIVGGTTLYTKSLLDPPDTMLIPSNKKRREELNAKSVEELQQVLKNISKDAYMSLNVSDIKNKRRIIRKIEIASVHNQEEIGNTPKITQKPILVGIFGERELLKSRIDVRIDERIQKGAVEEVEHLFKNYSRLSPQVKSANGYKQLFAYLNSEYSIEEAIQRWKFSEYRHAKNQMTYFKKYVPARWFDISQNNFEQSILKFISDSL